jgi:hypothetical protein
MFRRALPALLSTAACLSLAACGGEAPTAQQCQDQAYFDENTDACLDAARGAASEELGSAEEEAPVASEEPAVTEGPVTEPAAFPGDLTAEVVGVSTAGEADSDNPANDTRVLVTVRFTNNGSDTFAWSSDPNGLDAGPDADLFFGENRFEAQGYYNDQNQLPTQLVPGTSADWTGLYYMPGAELDTLALAVSPERGMFEPWTFTGVEALVTAG